MPNVLADPARVVVAALTTREREMLDCVLAGKSSKSAARQMHITVETARGYRARLYRKFAVNSAAALIARIAGDIAFRSIA